MYGTMFLEGSGSATSPPFTQNVNQSVAMMAIMPQAFPCEWVASLPGATGTVVDVPSLHDSFTDSLICGGAPPIQNYNWDSNGPGTTTQLVAAITPQSNIYGFSGGDALSGVEKETGCINVSTNVSIEWGPITGINEQFLPLPPTTELSGNMTFSAAPADIASTLPANWNLTWSFSPVPDDN
jgi:hypothetical protein